MIVFSLFNPQTFAPGVPLPAGWLLVTFITFLACFWTLVLGAGQGLFW